MALPSSASASGLRSCTVGQRERVANKNTTDKPPAMAARANVTNQGDSWGACTVPVASRVIGSVMANMHTPSIPSQKPRVRWRSSVSADGVRLGLIGGSSITQWR